METASILFVLLIFLGATAVCVALFDRLGFGSVVGFIVAGVIIGPNTPGPMVVSHVKELQNISELGVVLFLFAVGLEMRPQQFWAMRRELLGMGGGQVLLTALALGAFLVLAYELHWQSATIVALGLAMSSTAVVMSILADRGELSTLHGNNIFSILMAQDLSIVPVMALIPILAHGAAPGDGSPLWEKALLAAAVLAGVFGVARYLLPRALGWAARHRKNDLFGVVLFLGVIAAAWAVDQAGISMTLGAFLLGMLLSASDYRYQVEAVIEPFKGTLMGLFFIAVGMSINVHAMVADWQSLLLLVAVVLVIKTVVLVALSRAFRLDWQTSIRCGFYLSQVGEFAFVLFAASQSAGLLSAHGATLGFLVISISMITTPPMVKLGERVARHFARSSDVTIGKYAQEMSHHLVVVGLNEVGDIIALMAEKSGIPYIAVDNDYDTVRRSQKAGRNVFYGDVRFDSVRVAAGLARARAVFIASTEAGRVRAIALSLRQLYPELRIHVRVATIQEEEFLRSKGIEHAGTVYLESTLFRGEELLKDLGVSEESAKTLVDNLRKDNFRELKGATAPRDPAGASG
jgi:glutathione-regulated potassium-efflux system protein KefB